MKKRAPFPDALGKLTMYKLALVKWIADAKNGYHYNEPVPKDFGITQSQEVFMAKGIREEAMGQLPPPMRPKENWYPLKGVDCKS